MREWRISNDAVRATRNGTRYSRTDDELAEEKADLQDLRKEVRADLAANLGGEPDDYNAETHWKNGRGESGLNAIPNGGDST